MFNLSGEASFDIADRVDQLLERGVALVSLDVFDTLITRKVASPAALFGLLEKCIGQSIPDLPSNFRNGFSDLRRKAESDLYRKRGPAVTHCEIYETMQLSQTVLPQLLEEVRQLEIRLERELVVGIPCMVKLANSLITRGVPVVFSSDMYLSRDVIMELLVRGGVDVHSCDIHVSSELKKSKSDGTLFEWLLSSYMLRPSQLLHLGDNLRSDVRVPRRLGIHAIHIREAELSQREKDLVCTGSIEGQMLAGCSRAGRLSLQREGRLCSSARLGVELGGPIFTSYVGWILDHVRHSPNQRVYFVARDGQVFHRIAQALSAPGGANDALRYLYGSRQAWHLPGIHVVDEHVLDWLCEADPVLTLEILAKRLDMPSGSLSALLFGNGLSAVPVDRPLGRNQVKTLKRVLCSDEVSLAIREHAARAREGVLSYLRQEGALSGAVLNIVDIGWNGRIQDSLVRVLDGIGVSVNGYYFGLKRRNKPSAVQQKTAFFYSMESSLRRRSLGDKMNGILEVFASADHGSTKGYHLDENSRRWVPTFYAYDNNANIGWDIAAFRDGICAFAQEYVLLDRFFDYSERQVEAVRGSLSSLMTGFFEKPSLQEASLVGGVCWTSDQSSHRFRQFAPALVFNDALKYILLRKSGERMMVTSWVEGSIVQSGVGSRILLRWYLCVKCFLTFVRRLMSHEV